MEKMASDGPKCGQDDFFLQIQTLPTFGAKRICILIIYFFGFFGHQISGFPGPQISKFPNSQISRFPGFQTPPPAPAPPAAPPPDELSDPNLTPLPTHPRIKYVARALAAI